MRLLIITTNFPRWPGDPHSPWLIELLALLRDEEIDVEILAPAFAGGGSHEIDGMRVHRFRYAPARWERLTHEEGAPSKIRRNPLWLLLLPFYLLAGILATIRLTRQQPFDVVHVHWPVPQGLFALLARLVSPHAFRLVATFYGADLVLVRRFPVLQKFLRLFVSQCDDVAAISTYTRRELAELSGREARLIPYGIELPPADERWPARAGRILFVGRLIPRKGTIYLLRALGRLDDLPDAHLVIVGAGPERENLEAETHRLGLAKRVTFAGRVSDDELESHYQQASVFVLPAIVDESGDTEMLGMVLLEAMRYRKPVIASHVGGIPDIVVDEENGLLVPQKDVDALAAAIRRILTEPERAQAMGDAGYIAARNRFGWDAVLVETLALYDRSGRW